MRSLRSLSRVALAAIVLSLAASSVARADAPALRTVEPVVVVPGYPGYCPHRLYSSASQGVGLTQLLESPDPSWTVTGEPVAPVPHDRIYTWAFPERGVALNEQNDQCHAGSIRLLAKRFYNRLRTLRANWGYAGKVDVIGLSLGAEITRFCIVDPIKIMPGCRDMIDDWIGIAPPSHGSYLLNGQACSLIGFVLAPPGPCRELIPQSEFMRDLAKPGDDTPGDGEFTTFWSASDGVIQPGSSAALAGAANWRMRATATSGPFSDPNHLTIGSSRDCPGSRTAKAPSSVEWAAYEMLDVEPHQAQDGVRTCDVGPIPAPAH